MSNLSEVHRITSKRGSSVVIVYQDRQRLDYSVMVVPGRFPYWSDWPIRYADGTIGYDAPGKIPQYARRMVADAFRWIESQRVIFTLTPTRNLPDKSNWFIVCNQCDMQPYQCDSIIVSDIWEAFRVIGNRSLQKGYSSIEIRWQSN